MFTIKFETKISPNGWHKVSYTATSDTGEMEWHVGTFATAAGARGGLEDKAEELGYLAELLGHTITWK